MACWGLCQVGLAQKGQVTSRWPGTARCTRGEAVSMARKAARVSSTWTAYGARSLVVSLEGVVRGIVVVCIPCMFRMSSARTGPPQPQES